MNFDFEPCSVCNQEDGLYFCKLCAVRYCADHLCLHLSTAWESNTWSNRNASTNSSFNNSNLDFAFGYNAIDNSNQSDPVTKPASIAQTQEKSLVSYTEEQLESQLRFYQTQAKRIRNELERRAFALSPIAFEARRTAKNSTWKVYPSSKPSSGRQRNPINKKQQAAIEWLLNQIKAGSFTKQQIEIMLGKS